MTAMQQRDMNDSEWYAWNLSSARCGASTVQAEPPGVHDFEADLPNGTVAAVEITGDMNADRLALEAELETPGSQLVHAALPSDVLARSALTDCARSNPGRGSAVAAA